MASKEDLAEIGWELGKELCKKKFGMKDPKKVEELLAGCVEMRHQEKQCSSQDPAE
jgi:hypothetical protein